MKNTGAWIIGRLTGSIQVFRRMIAHTPKTL